MRRSEADPAARHVGDEVRSGSFAVEGVGAIGIELAIGIGCQSSLINLVHVLTNRGNKHPRLNRTAQAPQVDGVAEAARVLVEVVGDVGQQVGGDALALHHHPVLVGRVGGRLHRGEGHPLGGDLVHVGREGDQLLHGTQAVVDGQRLGGRVREAVDRGGVGERARTLELADHRAEEDVLGDGTAEVAAVAEAVPGAVVTRTVAEPAKPPRRFTVTSTTVPSFVR